MSNYSWVVNAVFQKATDDFSGHWRTEEGVMVEIGSHKKGSNV